MKTLSLLGQEIAPNRVKTWITYVGLDLVLRPAVIQENSVDNVTTPLSGNVESDPWNYKVSGVPSYAVDPNYRVHLAFLRESFALNRTSRQFSMLPFLQTATFPSLTMSHIPSATSADGIRASVSVVFVNPVSNFATSTVFDTLSTTDTTNQTKGFGYFPPSDVLSVGSWLGLFTRFYLPETLTREAWKGVPWVPFESPDFNRPQGSSGLDWDWGFPGSRDPWFVGRIASIEAVGETLTVKATNEESGFTWPRVPESGTFPPSRGQRLPIIYGFADHYSAPILRAPWHGTLASNLNDTQTEGIYLSPPFDGIPSFGNLWIGGEKVSYTSIDRSSGLLGGVSIRRIGGVEVGSATFHNAGTAVFAEGETAVALGTDEMSGISSLYVRANNGEAPVRIPSGYFGIVTKTATENTEIGSGTKEAVIQPDRFGDVVQLYQRATLSRQPVLSAPGVEFSEISFGVDVPLSGDESPWGATTQEFFLAKGDERDVSTQSGKRVFSTGSPNVPYLFDWAFDPLTLEYDSTSETIFAPATSSPSSTFGDPNDAGYMRVLWPLSNPASDWSPFSTYSDYWVTRIEFSYDLKISAIGKQQEFSVAMIGGGGSFYDVKDGDIVHSVVVDAGAPATYTLEWTLDVQASGYKLSDILQASRRDGGARFAVFPSLAFGGGDPDFTWEIEDSSGDKIFPSGKFFLQESSTDTTLDFTASDPTSIVAEASDDGTGFFAAQGLPKPSLNMNVIGLFEGKFQFINRQEIASPSVFGNPDTQVTGPGYWKMALDFIADLDAAPGSTVCLSWTLSLRIQGTTTAAHRYHYNFWVEDFTDSDIGPGIQADWANGERIEIKKNQDSAVTDEVDKELVSGFSTVRGSGDFGGDIDAWPRNPFGIRVFCQNAFKPEQGSSYDPFTESVPGFASESDPDDRPQFSVTATWTLSTTSTIDPPAGRGENVDQVPGAIVAHPGALNLEFFADGQGPLAVLNEEIDPEDDKSPSWRDFAALDSSNYGVGSVITNPTDILKRWIQKSETVSDIIRGAQDLDIWSADYNSGTWESSSENLNEHYRVFAYDSESPYEFGFDARNLGSDWGAVLARLAFEARTNLSRTTGSYINTAMPFAFLSAGRGPSFSFPAVSKQIDVSEVLEFNYLGKRASDFANFVSVVYDADDSRLGNREGVSRFRKYTQSSPEGLVGTSFEFSSASDVAGYSGGVLYSNKSLYQTGSETAVWIDFPITVLGSEFQSITVGLDRIATVGDPDSTFLGSLTYRSNSGTWNASGDAGKSTINYADYGLGDPTDGTPVGRPVYFTYNLKDPPTGDAAIEAAWEDFTDEWTAADESIAGVRIGLDSTLGSVASRWSLSSVTLSTSRKDGLISSVDLLGPRPISYALEAHRGSSGAEDWRGYIEDQLSDSSLMVEVVVATSVGWDVELGDVVTVDVPAQIIDEEVTPVASTVNIRVIGWERGSDGVALRGVIL